MLRYITPILLLLCLNSCITVALLGDASTHWQPQHAVAVKESSRDSAGNIQVNFIARLSTFKKKVPVHATFPVGEGDSLDIIKQIQVKNVGRIIELNGAQIKRGFINMQNDTSIHLAVAKKTDYYRFYVDSGRRFHRSHIMLEYTKPGTVDSCVVVCYSTPGKRKNGRYLLTPLAVAADVVTLPLQFIGWIVIVIAAKKVPIS